MTSSRTRRQEAHDQHERRRRRLWPRTARRSPRSRELTRRFRFWARSRKETRKSTGSQWSLSLHQAPGLHRADHLGARLRLGALPRRLRPDADLRRPARDQLRARRPLPDRRATSRTSSATSSASRTRSSGSSCSSASLAVALCGLGLEVGFFRPIYRRTVLTQLIVAFGFAFIIAGLIRNEIGGGGTTTTVRPPFLSAAARQLRRRRAVTYTSSSTWAWRSSSAVGLWAAPLQDGARPHDPRRRLATRSCSRSPASTSGCCSRASSCWPRSSPASPGARRRSRARSGPTDGDIIIRAFVVVVIGGLGSTSAARSSPRCSSASSRRSGPLGAAGDHRDRLRGARARAGRPAAGAFGARGA